MKNLIETCQPRCPVTEGRIDRGTSDESLVHRARTKQGLEGFIGILSLFFEDTGKVLEIGPVGIN